ncbi:MAG: HTH domain-containing protein [Thermodesulfobacteriota bacterium]|nr:HTH domain-containing protein [Thermodesulfobacteriota bacterium]
MIDRLQGRAKAKPNKCTSNIEIIRHILRTAGRPLHVSEIIDLAETQFQVTLERDSVVSAILKKIKAGKTFIKTVPNTFAVKETPSKETGLIS